MADISVYHVDNDETDEFVRAVQRVRSNHISNRFPNADTIDLQALSELEDGPLVGGEETADNPYPFTEMKMYLDDHFRRKNICNVLVHQFKRKPADWLTTDLPKLMQYFCKIADDGEDTLRTKILDEIPKIALFAKECSTRVPALTEIFSEHLLPIVIRNLGSIEQYLRKVSHRSLYTLIRDEFINKAQAEIQICPTVLALSRKDHLVYLHTDAIMLMSRLVLVLGRDITERVFLDRFAELCESEKFYVRKVCASQVGNFCGVLGKQSFEKVLLPCFIKLCSDPMWGVRKACADMMTPVSCACSPEVRVATLVPLQEHLLQDESRWVRISAYQWLGPFISTFAVPAITELSHNNEGELILLSNDGREFTMDSVICRDLRYLFYMSHEDPPERFSDYTDEIKESCGNDVISHTENKCDNLPSDNSTCSTKTDLVVDNFDLDITQVLQSVDLSKNSDDESSKKSVDSCEPSQGKDEDTLDLYNSYNYWYVPPDMPLDPLIVNAGDSVKTDNIETTVEHEGHKAMLEICSNNDNTFTLDKTYDVDAIEDYSVLPKKVAGPALPRQDIVPQQLIDYFTSMSEDSVVQIVDDNVARYCAYSLPAVAKTLGSENWPLLHDTFRSLAAHIHYQVRRSLASSLHELAIILGPDEASKELRPIFEELVKDMDEVRIEVLKHLSQFIQLNNPKERKNYFPAIALFVINDPLNWRFRYELCEQLIKSVNLFPAADSQRKIIFVGKRLLCDKVAVVRDMAQKLICQVLKSVKNKNRITPKMLIRLAEEFAHSKKWKLRQTFALLATELLVTESLSMDLYTSEIMPHLLDLSWDPVANVRLVVGRTIATHMVTNPYFQDPENLQLDGLETVLRRLQSDRDRDVREATITTKGQ